MYTVRLTVWLSYRSRGSSRSRGLWERLHKHVSLVVVKGCPLNVCGPVRNGTGSAESADSAKGAVGACHARALVGAERVARRLLLGGIVDRLALHLGFGNSDGRAAPTIRLTRALANEFAHQGCRPRVRIRRG